MIEKFVFAGLLIAVFLAAPSATAQDQKSEAGFGIHPRITHFSRNDFQADAQFWTMTRDKEGVYYFGNNDGAVVFDGERWQKVFLPNNSSVRSILTASNGKVYAGGFNELGIIESDSLGGYRFTSLLNDLELEKGRLHNLWQVHEFKDYIIYRSFAELIVISGSTATRISSSDVFMHSGIVNNKYYVQDSGFGILEFDPEKMVQNRIFSADAFNQDEIKAFLPSGISDEIVLVSKNGNLYKGNIKTGQVRLWKQIFEENFNDQVISAIKYNDNYLLGSLSSKILIVNEEGMIYRKPPSFVNISNSSILNLYRDGENIWALLNNGLDFIEFDSPVSQIFNEASISDILADENTLYLATNKGVFYSPFNRKDPYRQPFSFKKVPNLEGQAWSITKEKDAILIGHDKGLFFLKNGNPTKIGEVDGFWKIIKIRDSENAFLAANYSGLYYLTREENSWVLQHKLKGFEESTRDILQADSENTFWVCHGYKGVYKLKINNDYSRVYAVEHYTDQNGLKSPFNVNVTRWEGDIVFTTNNGLYEYNENLHEFQPYKPLQNIISNTYNTRKLFREGEKVWVVRDDEIGYFKFGDEDPVIERNLFLDLKGNLNRGMESIRPLENGEVLIGATTGLYLYDTNFKPKETIPTKITRVGYLQGGDNKQLQLKHPEYLKLGPKTETIRFEFAAPGISPSATVQYQYLLDGIEEKWSSWDDAAYKEYTHLPPGHYTFRVRSRDLMGRTGEEANFNLYIAPVWYKTMTAYFIYFIIFVIVSAMILRLIKRIIEQEKLKAREDAEKNQKLLELQIEQLQLEKDKETIKKDKQLLEEDNILKSKELANYTMMLVKKKDVFTETYENLQEFKKSLKTQAAKKKLQEVLMKLNQHRIGEEYMTVFDVHFEKVHKNFFKELKTLSPDLTQRELRLCAFVKMNLTNKEIAPLLNISVRGVETARYRVRKKLELQEVNFNSFLENLATQEENPRDGKNKITASVVDRV